MKKIVLLVALVLCSVDFYGSYKTTPTSVQSFESLMNLDSPDFGNILASHDRPLRRKRIKLDDACSSDYDIDQMNRDLVPFVVSIQKNNQDSELDRMNKELAPYIRSTSKKPVAPRKLWSGFMGCCSNSAVVSTDNN